jgi:hypothetical protein
VRPILRPGLQVLRRDVRTLQLGLDWPGIATISDSPALRAVLDAIDGFRDPTAVVLAAADTGPAADECRAALDALFDAGAVIDQAATVRTNLDEAAWAALWLLAGPDRDARDVAEARATCAVHVRGTGRVCDAVRRLLADVPLRVSEDPAAADVVLIATDHEPEREQADRAMSEGLPHLWVLVRELVGVLGPFVLPGKTACLRCVDATRTELDPAWPTLVESSTRRRGHVHACDPVLATLMATWAVHEVCVWASGLRPQSWDRTIEVPHGVGVVHRERYDPHPACGCGWSVWHDTMGA